MRKLIEAGVACILFGCSAPGSQVSPGVVDAGVAPKRAEPDAGARNNAVSAVAGMQAGVAGASVPPSAGVSAGAAASGSAGTQATATAGAAGPAAPSGMVRQPCEPVPAGRQLAFPGAEGSLSHLAAQSGDKLQNEKDLGVGEDGYGELPAGRAPQDTDGDGMPDAWESQHALDPKAPDDRNGDTDGDGYTNLEAYLNELAAPVFQR